jgi:hypothetical protein
MSTPFLLRAPWFCAFNPFTGSFYLFWDRPMNNSTVLPVETGADEQELFADH